MAATGSGKLTLLLNHEIAAVITAMRYNSKWAVVPRSYYEEDRNEPNKYDEAFRTLRSEIFKYSDWSQVDPMVYLAPFLSLIKAQDVSGPITGAAAVALQRILSSDLLAPGTLNVEAAINQIVEDATQCKFESTNNTSDEVVLLNIVQVLGMAVESHAGVLLTDESICKAVQAAFMLGDPVTKPKEYGDIMAYYSRQTCGRMIRTVFTKVAQHLIATHDNLGKDESQQRPVPLLRYSARAAVSILEFLVELIAKAPTIQAGATKEQVEETVIFALDMVQEVLCCAGNAVQLYAPLMRLIQVELLFSMCQVVVLFNTVNVITGFCQTLLAVYHFLGNVSMGQIEMVLERVLLKLADGKGVLNLEQQEAALEGILDLCRQPGFVHDVFANCDCRIERANLFEDICSLLSKTATPVGKSAATGGQAPVGPLLAISLEGLMAILNALAHGPQSGAPLVQPPPPGLEASSYVDLWAPLVCGQHPDLAPLMEAAGNIMSAAEHLAEEAAASSPEYQALKAAVYERHLKQKVLLSVDHFNKDAKKGFMALQASHLLPELRPTGDAEKDAATSDYLATRLGQFLRVCPGLSKASIGELLGEPDPFYLKALESYTIAFDFESLKFDLAIRMYLESFKLPGEAQKIDRIINSFGKHYYAHNRDVFNSADAAYVLAYSVIMLNTDQHNTQVKNKMTLEAFRRNLRGVNEGADFDPKFLEELYYSIVKTPLRMSDASVMDVSEQTFVTLQQMSGTARGTMVPTDAGRHLFDSTMFRLVWRPAVHAMCQIVDVVNNETLIEEALQGLQLASQTAAAHCLEGVADSVVVAISKIPLQLALAHVQRPEVMFVKDARMRPITRTIATIVNKHGDCLRGGWTNVLDLIVGLYRQGMLPDTFTKALAGDGDGGLVVREGEGSSLKLRRAMAKASAASSSTMFRHIYSFTSMLTMQSEPEYPGGAAGLRGADGGSASSANPQDAAFAAAAEEVLAKCAFEDIFMDSKFLKQESLVHLVRAILAAGGQIPRGAASSGSQSWDVAELCLELCFTVLLRNRDRIALLWPRIYEHFQNIFSHSKECDIVLVQKAIMAMMRLCQRLLPYKADISEPLMKGMQLVSLVDDQVASDLAYTIAIEILNLLKGAAAYIHNQQAWISICSLIKIIQYDPPSFPVCLETLSWVVKESLTMLNYTIVMQTVVDLLEHALPDTRRGERQGHPEAIPAILNLMLASEEWLELWWEQSLAKHTVEQKERLGLEPFKLDAWYMLVAMLCKLSNNSNLEVRTASVSYLQRAVVAAEKLDVSPDFLYRSLDQLILPLMKDLSKALAGKHAEATPQADATIRDVVRAVSKMVLLYLPALERQATFGLLWRAILDGLMATATAAGGRSEVLSEAVPEAVKNMLLILHNKGTLKEGWVDTDGTDLWELTWRTSKKISPNLTPQLMSG